MFVCKAYERALPESDSQQGEDDGDSGGNAERKSLRSWRNDFKGYSRRAVEVAAERGTFAALRFSFCRFVVNIRTSCGRIDGKTGLYVSRDSKQVIPVLCLHDGVHLQRACTRLKSVSSTKTVGTRAPQ